MFNPKEFIKERLTASTDSSFVQILEPIGYVTDLFGKPLHNVNIAVVGNEKIGTSTNEKGYFKMPFVSSLSVLKFSHLGYENALIPVKSINGNTIKLNPEMTVLDEVNISTKPKSNIVRNTLIGVGLLALVYGVSKGSKKKPIKARL